MQRIFPAGAGQPNSVDAPEHLADLYAFPEPVPQRGVVRAMMITSIDGAAQGPDGKSGSLSTPADRRVLGLMRGLADVVLVGAETTRVEGYGPADVVPECVARRDRLGLLPTPPIAVVSRSLALDPAAPLFSAPPRRTIVLTVESSPRDRRAALAEVSDVVVVGERDVDVAAARRALLERGFGRILCEGGPRLLASVVTADELDELCATVSPMTTGGDATRLLAGAPAGVRSWRLAHVVEDDNTLLLRWVRP